MIKGRVQRTRPFFMPVASGQVVSSDQYLMPSRANQKPPFMPNGPPERG